MTPETRQVIEEIRAEMEAKYGVANDNRKNKDFPRPARYRYLGECIAYSAILSYLEKKQGQEEGE